MADAAPRSATPRRLAGFARVAGGLATGLCVLALPLGLIATNVRLVALDRAFYLAEFVRYDRGAAAGLTPEELRLVADSFISYFLARPGRLNVQIARPSGFQPLFNERELVHMEDVQSLMHAVLRVQAVALGYVGLYALAGLALHRHRFFPLAARVLAAGASLTLAIVLGLAVLALADFQGAFVQFHLLSFDNDLWLLDPERDNLIRLFPQEFFLDATLRIAALTIVEAFALAAIGGASLWATRPRHPR